MGYKGGWLMRLDVECCIALQAPWATPAVLMLTPQSGLGQTVVAESLTVDPASGLRLYNDLYGNHCHRLVLPAGPITVTATAIVDVPDEVDVDVTAPLTPFDELPDWVIQFCLPSRYCHSDVMRDQALEIVGTVLPGYPQVEAIRAWIASSVRYEYGTSDFSTTASDTFQTRAGVCRDFAHLGIALCRAIEIPARMVVGYLHELDPMDQHAWWEAYVGGRWYTFDATQAAAAGQPCRRRLRARRRRRRVHHAVRARRADVDEGVRQPGTRRAGAG